MFQQNDARAIRCKHNEDTKPRTDKKLHAYIVKCAHPRDPDSPPMTLTYMWPIRRRSRGGATPSHPGAASRGRVSDTHVRKTDSLVTAQWTVHRWWLVCRVGDWWAGELIGVKSCAGMLCGCADRRNCWEGRWHWIILGARMPVREWEWTRLVKRLRGQDNRVEASWTRSWKRIWANLKATLFERALRHNTANGQRMLSNRAPVSLTDANGSGTARRWVSEYASLGSSTCVSIDLCIESRSVMSCHVMSCHVIH